MRPSDDIWDKEVESEIDHLTSEDEEYYPFTIKHIEEAITQQSDADWMIFAMYAIPTNNFIIHEIAHKNISDTCAKYWRDVAREQAEKNVNMRSR